jgi:hypothetical protein
MSMYMSMCMYVCVMLCPSVVVYAYAYDMFNMIQIRIAFNSKIILLCRCANELFSYA